MNIPKIIELIIEDNDDNAGLDGIALVELPAHEANFEYFSEQIEDPKHYVLSEEETPKALELFKSFGESQGQLELEGWYISSVRELSRQDFQIVSRPNEPSAQDTPDVRFRYKYVGPISDNSRDFCKEMMKANRVFRIEDIQEMSLRSINPVGPDGYDMFTWRGSYNCRHRWVQLVYKNDGRITNNTKVETGVIDEDGMPGPDTRTTSTINAGNTPPRTGFSTGNPDVSGLSPYVDQVTEEVEKKPVLTNVDGNLNVLGYQTKFFHLCPGAIETFQHLISMPLNDETQGMVRSASQIADNVFRLESEVMERGSVTKDELVEAVILVEDFKDLIREIDEETGMIHNVNYMDGHIEKITSYYEDDEEIMELGSELEEFAKVGERGGISESKKAPKSDTPNPDPKGEGTAKGDASGKRGAVVSERVEKILEDKVKDFNERYKDKLDYGVDKGMLKSVYQRGVGAYNVSHSPKVRSSEQWALARVNAFLYMVKNGRPQNKKYTGDNDLLPKKHPKYQEQSRQEFQSYDDYPESVKNNACKVIKWKEEYGNEVQGMTQVGWIRANQLCKGEKISEDTIARMSGFRRHEKNSEVSPEYKDTPWKDKGYVAWLGWGGTTGINWASDKLKSIRNEEFSSDDTIFHVFNEEQRLLIGPAMIPDKMIIRRNEITGEIYYVYFTKETIKKLQQKFMQEKLLDKTNIEHGRKFLNDVDVVESWIIEDREKDKQQVFGMDYPKGTWMISVKVSDDETWKRVKDGKLRGFSVQGYFMEKARFKKDDMILDEIKEILKNVR